MLRAVNFENLYIYIQNILNGNKIHNYYNDSETLYILEGLSNKQVVGDWQHFLTIKYDFIFELPQEQQEKIAENFSIGNNSAKQCLIELWKNHIKTSGTDIIRPTSLGATNCITISTSIEEIPIYSEILARNLPSKNTFLFACFNEKLKSGIISIHFTDDYIFDNIRYSAKDLKEKRIRENKLEENSSNYWEMIQKYASLHNITPIQYIDVRNIGKFRERMKENVNIAQISSRLSQQQTQGIIARIKKVPRNLFEKVSAFLINKKLEKNIDKKENER